MDLKPNFTIEHSFYKDVFSGLNSKSSFSDKSFSSQPTAKADEASPAKRKLHQSQSGTYTKCARNESTFCHETGQLVENSGRLLSRLSSLFNSSELSDVRLIVLSGAGERREYPAHKLVLCCASEVFKIMLTGAVWNESSSSEVCLGESSSSEVFEMFLEYLYSGMINLSHSTVLSVLSLADKYNVKDLQEVCIEYMCSHLVSTVEWNRSVSWMQYSKIAGHKHLTNECQQFIMWNFFKILSCSDFQFMEYDTLLFFLKQSDLVVPDEFILYQGVMRWWLNDCDDGKSESFDVTDAPPMFSCKCSLDHESTYELFSYIRFPLMTHTQLKAIQSDVKSTHLDVDILMQKEDTLTSEKSKKLKMLLSIVEEFVEKALALQDIAKRNNFKDLSMYFTNEFSNEQVTLRNYTNEVWSTTLCIDKFSSLQQHEVRSVVFSSPSSSLLPDETNPAWDWTVELFPKGVSFQKCIMIGLWRNVEVHGDVYNTVRLALHCNHPRESPGLNDGTGHRQRNVVVCVLVTGVQDNAEHICRVEKRFLSFDGFDKTRHLNDLVPYNLLNNVYSSSSSSSSSSKSFLTKQFNSSSPCSLLSGPDGDSFKITIVIKPSVLHLLKQNLL